METAGEELHDVEGLSTSKSGKFTLVGEVATEDTGGEMLPQSLAVSGEIVEDVCGETPEKKRGRKRKKTAESVSKPKSKSKRGRKKGNLTGHIKPCVCEKCGQHFTRTGNMYTHMRTIHGMDLRYSCSRCDQKFDTRWRLVRHMYAAHEELRPLMKRPRKIFKSTHPDPIVIPPKKKPEAPLKKCAACLFAKRKCNAVRPCTACVQAGEACYQLHRMEDLLPREYACVFCAVNKLHCDGMSPCEHCIRRGQSCETPKASLRRTCIECYKALKHCDGFEPCNSCAINMLTCRRPKDPSEFGTSILPDRKLLTRNGNPDEPQTEAGEDDGEQLLEGTACSGQRRVFSGEIEDPLLFVGDAATPCVLTGETDASSPLLPGEAAGVQRVPKDEAEAPAVLVGCVDPAPHIDSEPGGVVGSRTAPAQNHRSEAPASSQANQPSTAKAAKTATRRKSLKARTKKFSDSLIKSFDRGVLRTARKTRVDRAAPMNLRSGKRKSAVSDKRHWKEDSGSNLPRCLECGLQFVDKNNLRQHMLQHEREASEYVCPCGKRFLKNYGLRTHQVTCSKSHMDPTLNGKAKAHFTPIASSSNEDESHVTADKKRRRPRQPEKSFVCACGLRFMFKNQFKKHERTCPENTRCLECGLQFADKKSLRAHSWIHPSEPLSCPECGRKWSDKTSLSAHMRQHGREKLPCPECGLTFSYKGSLDSHVALHKKGKLACSEYGPESSEKASPNAHVVQHRSEEVPGLRASPCGMRVCPCGREYLLESSMRAHQKSCRIALSDPTDKSHRLPATPSQSSLPPPPPPPPPSTHSSVPAVTPPPPPTAPAPTYGIHPGGGFTTPYREETADRFFTATKVFESFPSAHPLSSFPRFGVQSQPAFVSSSAIACPIPPQPVLNPQVHTMTSSSGTLDTLKNAGSFRSPSSGMYDTLVSTSSPEGLSIPNAVGSLCPSTSHSTPSLDAGTVCGQSLNLPPPILSVPTPKSSGASYLGGILLSPANTAPASGCVSSGVERDPFQGVLSTVSFTLPNAATKQALAATGVRSSVTNFSKVPWSAALQTTASEAASGGLPSTMEQEFAFIDRAANVRETRQSVDGAGQSSASVGAIVSGAKQELSGHSNTSDSPSSPSAYVNKGSIPVAQSSSSGGDSVNPARAMSSEATTSIASSTVISGRKALTCSSEPQPVQRTPQALSPRLHVLIHGGNQHLLANGRAFSVSELERMREALRKRKSI